MNSGMIIQIDDCLVSGEIIEEYFACDYEKCKGICCIVGDSGAPLEECELEALEKNYDAFSPSMTPEGRGSVGENGFFVIDRDGDIVTPLVPGSEECAYSRKSAEGACYCCIEACWHKGMTDFRKPISCSLYPIRVSRLSNGLQALNLHRWDVCRDAYAKGRKEGVRVYQFLKEPIVRYWGEDFWEALDAAAASVGGSEKA